MTKKSETEVLSKIPRTPGRFFVFVSKPYWVWVFISSFFVIAAAGGDVYIRFFIEKIINEIESENQASILFWVLLYPIFHFAISFTWRLSGYFGRIWLLGVPKITTNILTKYISQHSHIYYSNRFTGSIGNKISNVTQAMEDFVEMSLWSYLENIVPLLVTGIVFLFTDLLVGVLYFVLIITSIILNAVLMPRKRKFSLALATSQSKTTGFLVDVISNMQTVRQFIGFERELSGVEKHTTDVEKKGKVSFLYSEYTMFVNSLLFTAFAIVMFILLLNKWQLGEISSGRLVTFILLISYTSHTVIFLGRILSQTAKQYGKAQEGLSDLLLPPEIVDTKDAYTLTVPHGKIEWHNVTFEYGENKVFKDFTLTIPSGQRLGLVGASGAGKSTFVSLLLRQHDLQTGSIVIDGQPIHEVTQNSLRQNIAVVPQEPALFHRTIRENIAYGKPHATDEEIIAVAKQAFAHNFIMSLPEQYNTLVGERGVKLSGGQKQRIAIARAMLKDAPVLILDEATSALDSESEAIIQKALHLLMAGKTVIAIAHRLSTLREMDRIVVLDSGRIIEDGSHEVLKEYDGVYKKLWEHQAGGFVSD